MREVPPKKLDFLSVAVLMTATLLLCRQQDKDCAYTKFG